MTDGFIFDFDERPSEMTEEDWAKLRELSGRAAAAGTLELVERLEEFWEGRVVLDAASVFVGLMAYHLQHTGPGLVATLELRPEASDHFIAMIDLVRGSPPTTESDEPAAMAEMPDVRAAALAVYRMLAATPGGLNAESADACARMLHDSLYPDRPGV